MNDSETNEEQQPDEPVRPAFSLRLSGDRMALYIDGEISPERLADLTKQVHAEMAHMGLGAQTYLSRATERLAEACVGGSKLSGYTLLEGKRPTPPKEGELVWTNAYFEKGFEIDPETDMMDYRRPKGRKSVARGEHLATLRPASPGEDGRDLTGKPIPTGKPRPFRVRAGANVDFSESTGQFHATKDGHLRFAGNVVSVDDIYTINGNVGLKSGNVTHPGSLVITGNVESDSSIEAGGDVEIQGYVEDAAITTQGGLLVHGGIAGGPQCRIRAENGVHARYIQVADIEAGGDVVAEHEIDQCTIKTRGAVIVTHGRIVGGDTVALGGIETDQIGSEAFLHTTLTAGEDYTIRRLVETRKEELNTHRENLNKIADRLAPLKERASTLPPRLRELAKSLLHEATKINEAIKRIEEELETIRNESQAHTKKEVTVRKHIFPDALFHLPPFTLLVQDEIQGPVKVKIHDGQVALLRL